MKESSKSTNQNKAKHNTEISQLHNNDNVLPHMAHPEKKLVRILKRNTRYRVTYKEFHVNKLKAYLTPLVFAQPCDMEKVDRSLFPSVFVCNHYEFFGPLSAMVSIPFKVRPWIDNRMLNESKANDHIYRNTMSKKKMPEFLKKGYCRIASIWCAKTLNELEPIPVARDNVYNIMETIQESVSALVHRENILIFPENSSVESDGRYRLDDISSFYSGFTHIAKRYYAQTQKKLTFYPLYISKKKHTMTFGDGVTFDPQNHFSKEKTRIVSELYNSMKSLMNRDEEPS